MLSHIKRLIEWQGYVVCYSIEDMDDRVNQGKLFFLANCQLSQKQFLNWVLFAILYFMYILMFLL